MNGIPSWIAQAATPIGLATRLLDEIARGMVPVWPTTRRHADRLVEGLELARERRGPEVIRAILRAPADGPLPWSRLLKPLTS